MESFLEVTMKSELGTFRSSFSQVSKTTKLSNLAGVFFKNRERMSRKVPLNYFLKALSKEVA